MAVIKFVYGIEFQSQLLDKMVAAIKEIEEKPEWHCRFNTEDEYWHSRCYVALDAVWEDICDTILDLHKNEK